MEKRKTRVETDRGKKRKEGEEGGGRGALVTGQGISPQLQVLPKCYSALNHIIPPLALLPCCRVLRYSLTAAKPWVKKTLRQKRLISTDMVIACVSTFVSSKSATAAGTGRWSLPSQLPGYTKEGAVSQETSRLGTLVRSGAWSGHCKVFKK